MGEYENPTYKGGGQEWMAFQQGFQSSFDSWFGKMAAYGDKLKKKKEKYQTGVDVTQDRMMSAVDNIKNWSQEGGENARKAIAQITSMLRDGDYTRDEQIQIASDFIQSINTKGRVLDANINFDENNYSKFARDERGLDLVRNIGNGVSSFWEVTKDENGRIVINSGLRESIGDGKYKYHSDSNVDIYLGRARDNATNYKANTSDHINQTNIANKMVTADLKGNYNKYKDQHLGIPGIPEQRVKIEENFGDEAFASIIKKATDTKINDPNYNSEYVYNNKMPSDANQLNTNDFTSAGGTVDNLPGDFASKLEDGVFIPFIDVDDENTYIDIDGNGGLTEEEMNWNKKIAEIQKQKIENWEYMNLEKIGRANNQIPSVNVIKPGAVQPNFPVIAKGNLESNITDYLNIRDQINDPKSDVGENALNTNIENVTGTWKDINESFNNINNRDVSVGLFGLTGNKEADRIQVERTFTHNGKTYIGHTLQTVVDNIIKETDPSLLNLPPEGGTMDVSYRVNEEGIPLYDVEGLNIEGQTMAEIKANEKYNALKHKITKNTTAGTATTFPKSVASPEYKLATTNLENKRKEIVTGLAVGGATGNIRFRFDVGQQGTDYKTYNLNKYSDIDHLSSLIEKHKNYKSGMNPAIEQVYQNLTVNKVVDRWSNREGNNIENEINKYRTNKGYKKDKPLINDDKKQIASIIAKNILGSNEEKTELEKRPEYISLRNTIMLRIK